MGQEDHLILKDKEDNIKNHNDGLGKEIRLFIDQKHWQKSKTGKDKTNIDPTIDIAIHSLPCEIDLMGIQKQKEKRDNNNNNHNQKENAESGEGKSKSTSIRNQSNNFSTNDKPISSFFGQYITHVKNSNSNKKNSGKLYRSQLRGRLLIGKKEELEDNFCGFIISKEDTIPATTVIDPSNDMMKMGNNSNSIHESTIDTHQDQYRYESSRNFGKDSDSDSDSENSYVHRMGYPINAGETYSNRYDDDYGNYNRPMGEGRNRIEERNEKNEERFVDYDSYLATGSFSRFYQWGHDSSVEDRFGSLLCPLHKLRKWQRIHQAIHLDSE